ncbi:unnamed protein product, partial [Scytosiphon promiscuus]
HFLCCRQTPQRPGVCLTDLAMHVQQAQAPTPNTASVSPPPLTPHVVVHQTHGLCVPAGISGDVASVHKISIMILITHILALVVYCFAFGVWAPWALLTMVALTSNLAGIVISTIVVCAET